MAKLRAVDMEVLHKNHSKLSLIRLSLRLSTSLSRVKREAHLPATAASATAVLCYAQ
jgi:hypothetical protein